MAADKVRLNAYISKRAFTILKVKAAKAGVTMTEMLEEMLNPTKKENAA